jgi:hypothetical protein
MPIRLRRMREGTSMGYMPCKTPRLHRYSRRVCRPRGRWRAERRALQRDPARVDVRAQQAARQVAPARRGPGAGGRGNERRAPAGGVRRRVSGRQGARRRRFCLGRRASGRRARGASPAPTRQPKRTMSAKGVGPSRVLTRDVSPLGLGSGSCRHGPLGTRAEAVAGRL